MKILHMISGGDVGGAKTHVLSLLRGLCARHEILLICFMEGPFAQEARAMDIPVEIIATTSSTPQEPVMAKIRPKAVLSCSMRPVTRPLPEAVAAKAAVHLYNK